MLDEMLQKKSLLEQFVIIMDTFTEYNERYVTIFTWVYNKFILIVSFSLEIMVTSFGILRLSLTDLLNDTVSYIQRIQTVYQQ